MQSISLNTAFETRPLAQACEVLYQHLAKACPVGLFTLSKVDDERQLATRVYSSNEIVYPLSGTKPYPQNTWTDIVIRDKQIFVANSLAAIKDVFFDYETIAALGLGAVINLPVIINKQLIGSANILAAEGQYGPAQINTLQQFYPWFTSALLQYSIDKGI